MWKQDWVVEVRLGGGGETACEQVLYREEPACLKNRQQVYLAGVEGRERKEENESPAKRTQGPHPEWPPPATRLLEVLGSPEPLPLYLLLPPSFIPWARQAAASRSSGFFYIKTAKHQKGN